MERYTRKSQLPATFITAPSSTLAQCVMQLYTTYLVVGDGENIL